MPNEVIIVVKGRNDTKRVFDAIRREARQLGDDVGVEITASTGRRLEREASATAGAYARSGDQIGEAIGRRVSERISERVRESVNRSTDGSRGRARDARGRFISGAGSGGLDGGRGGDGGDGGDGRVTVDVDKQSILQRLGNLGKDIGTRIQGALSTAVTSFFSGDFISIIAKTLTVGALVAVLLPTFGAALGTVIMMTVGGGFIAAGVRAAFKDPQVMAEAKAFKDRASKLWESFGQNFKSPVLNFFENLEGVLDQITPLAKDLGRALEPVADALGDGIIGMLQNLLPSVFRMAEDSAPLIETLAGELPGIGDAIARMLDHISENADTINVFWNDFLNGVQLVIRVVGVLIDVFIGMYRVVRTIHNGLIITIMEIIGAVVDAAAAAFGWIPGIGDKLKRGQKQFKEFKEKVNSELRGIDDVEVTIRIRQVFTTVGNAVGDVGAILARRAHGGVVGQAAGGGARSGLTWVGEHGPELADLPAGSRIYSAGDSRRMAASGGGGGGTPIVVQFLLDGRLMAEKLVDPTREMIDRRFGGSVQAAFGRAG